MLKIPDALKGLLGAGAEIFNYNTGSDAIGEMNDEQQDSFAAMSQDARDNTAFKPFSITSSSGSAAAKGDEGTFTGLDVSLNDAQKAAVDAQRAAAGSLYTTAGTSIGTPTFGTAPTAPSFGGIPELQGGMGALPTTPTFGTLPTGPSFGGIPQLQGGMLDQVAGPTFGALPTGPTFGGIPQLQGGMGALPTSPGLQQMFPNGIPPQVSMALEQSGLFSPEQQAAQFGQGQIGAGLQGAVGQGGNEIRNQLGIGTGRSEQELFQMLEGMQEPGRERDRLQLRDELAGQGRTGLRTNMFGGSPEELARAKAVEEGRSANAFRAFQAAGEEQGRLANQGLQAFQLGETAAGRQDSGLLESFGLANQSTGMANDLTRALGGLGLQGRQIGNQFQQQNLAAGIDQRGQDIGAGTAAGTMANNFNLSMFGQESQNVAQQAAVSQEADRLRLAGQGQEANQLLQSYATQMSGTLGQGQLDLGEFGQKSQNAATKAAVYQEADRLKLIGQGQEAEQLLRRYATQQAGVLEQGGLDLGLFGQESQNVAREAAVSQEADRLRLAGQGQEADQLLRSYATQVQSSLGQGELELGLYGEQGRQQAQQGALADSMFRSSFLPEQNLLDQMGLGVDAMEIAQRGQIQGEQMAQNTETNRLDALIGGQVSAANLENARNKQMVEMGVMVVVSLMAYSERVDYSLVVVAQK